MSRHSFSITAIAFIPSGADDCGVSRLVVGTTDGRVLSRTRPFHRRIHTDERDTWNGWEEQPDIPEMPAHPHPSGERSIVVTESRLTELLHAERREEWREDAERVHAALLIAIGDNRMPQHGVPSLETIVSWSPGERAAVLAWAGALHAHAGDNDDVVVPEKPAVMLAWEREQSTLVKERLDRAIAAYEKATETTITLNVMANEYARRIDAAKRSLASDVAEDR